MTAIITATITPAAAVDAGGAHLDEREPGWAARTNLDRLDMSDPNRCILAQLYGGFLEGMEQLRLDDRAAVRLGFEVGIPPEPVRRGDYAVLDTEWRRAVTGRLTWTADLKCGCQMRGTGHQPEKGGYVTCTASLAHQATYRITDVRAGTDGWAAA